MCINYKTVNVPIPDFMKHDPLCCFQDDSVYQKGGAEGEYTVDNEGRKCYVIDACLVPVLKALWDAGIKTTASCCGYGSGSGVIGILTEYNRRGKHLTESVPYDILGVVERRRHENAAYGRGRQDAFVEAGREDLWLENRKETN